MAAIITALLLLGGSVLGPWFVKTPVWYTLGPQEGIDVLMLMSMHVALLLHGPFGYVGDAAILLCNSCSA